MIPYIVFRFVSILLSRVLTFNEEVFLNWFVWIGMLWSCLLYTSDNPLRFFCVSFSFNKADPRYSSYEEIERFFDSFDYPIAMDKNNISAGFVGALNEMANWGKMSEELMISHLSQIIIYTYRSFQSEKSQRYFSSLHIDTTKKFIYEIINYIDSDLTEINKLQTLGDKLGYNYSYTVSYTHLGSNPAKSA